MEVSPNTSEYTRFVHNLRALYKGNHPHIEGSSVKIFGNAHTVPKSFPMEYTFYDEDVGVAVSIVYEVDNEYTLLIEPLEEGRIFIDISNDVSLHAMRVRVVVKDNTISYYLGRNGEHEIRFEGTEFEQWLFEWAEQQSVIEVPADACDDVLEEELPSNLFVQWLLVAYNNAYMSDAFHTPYIDEAVGVDKDEVNHRMELHGMYGTDTIDVTVIITTPYEDDGLKPWDTMNAMLSLTIGNGKNVYVSTREAQSTILSIEELVVSVISGAMVCIVLEDSNGNVYEEPLSDASIITILDILKKTNPVILPYQPS